jgi:hypothetical protein
MKNIGLITYHATHNYGAVLQAFATQYTIEKLGVSCEIINFQPPTMKYFNSLYKFPIGRGIQKTLRNILGGVYYVLRDISCHKKRRLRGKKFDAFVVKYLKMTKKYHAVHEILNEQFNYDITIVGSDQTLNIHCPLWMINNHYIDYSLIYFLGFVKSGKRASFASSTNNTTTEELAQYKNLLSKFDYITVRDVLEKERIEKVVKQKVTAVLDPTFLLTKEEWIETFNVPLQPIIKEPYILLYSLGSSRRVEKLIQETLKIANKKSLAFVCLTPNACKRFAGTIQLYDVGPIDFLNLYHNASYIIAETFHAVVFSIIFRKPFLCLRNKYNQSDTRINSLLQTFGLETRLFNDESEIGVFSWESFDYSAYEQKIINAIHTTRKHLQNILALS